MITVKNNVNYFTRYLISRYYISNTSITISIILKNMLKLLSFKQMNLDENMRKNYLRNLLRYEIRGKFSLE